jgi:hypothetical protein
MVRYKLRETSVRRILKYDYPERRWPNRKGPAFLLLDAKVDEIINYSSELWEHRILKFDVIRAELRLKCSVQTLTVVCKKVDKTEKQKLRPPPPQLKFL